MRPITDLRTTTDHDERDRELADLFERYVATRDVHLRDEIVDRTAWIAIRSARRFANRGEPLDDLLQVARLGLLKAIERFDPSHGHHFAAFATPTILGELRRYFRDHTWSIHVPRRAKDIRPLVNAAVDELTATLGRPPRLEEIADRVGHPPAVVTDALRANSAYRTRSIDLGTHQLDTGDRALDLVDDRHMVTELMSQLDPRAQRILYLRYYEELSQARIAEMVGISQVHVGRLLAASLERMRQALVPQIAG